MSGKNIKGARDSNKPKVVNFECDDCDEQLRGLEGQIAKCPACGHLQDAPYDEELSGPTRAAR